MLMNTMIVHANPISIRNKIRETYMNKTVYAIMEVCTQCTHAHITHNIQTHTQVQFEKPTWTRPYMPLWRYVHNAHTMRAHTTAHPTHTTHITHTPTRAHAHTTHTHTRTHTTPDKNLISFYRNTAMVFQNVGNGAGTCDVQIYSAKGTLIVAYTTPAIGAGGLDSNFLTHGSKTLSGDQV